MLWWISTPIRSNVYFMSAGSRSWVTQRVEFRAFFRFLYFAPASNEPQDRNTKQHSDWSWCTVMHSDDLESCVGVWGVLLSPECLHGTWYAQWDCGQNYAWRGEFSKKNRDVICFDAKFILSRFVFNDK
jgi:hypothetical protein